MTSLILEKKSNFEIVTTKTGAVSIRNNLVNEIMHNPVGPWKEANALYVEQSGLRERLSQDSQDELVLFDVGLGAAANALAALICARSLPARSRPFRIVSFERDLELLQFAVANASVFEHFHGFETALAQILTSGAWAENGISWILRRGDFLDLIDSETYRPHVIFFDPYSPKVNQDMWTTRCFEKIRHRSREKEAGGTSLFTYSQATRIRVALLKAGFHVGYGIATGLKNETTVATTDLEQLSHPLGTPWFERWRASHDRYPYDCGPEDEKTLDIFIEQQSDLARNELVGEVLK